MRFAGLVLAGALASTSAVRAQEGKVTFVIVHGAWGGSWDWKVVDSMLTARGQSVYRPALTGLGERVHLSSPAIGLGVHVEDVVNTILWEELDDVVLVGHSYGGMVITGVADRIPERIARLVYLDAFLPDSGESLVDILPQSLAGIARTGNSSGMVVPAWVSADQPIPKDVPHPQKTFTDTLHLKNPARSRIPVTYILTAEPSEAVDAFQPFADRARQRGYEVRRLAADHIPERSARAPLVEMLLSISLPPATADDSRSGALFDELARLDSVLFDAAFISCNNPRIDSLLARDIEFYHDQNGVQVGDEVRQTFERLTGNCPRDNGVRRELVPGSLQVFPIANYGAMQMGLHRFLGGGSVTVARFMHVWRRKADGSMELARVLSLDHRTN